MADFDISPFIDGDDWFAGRHGFKDNNSKRLPDRTKQESAGASQDQPDLVVAQPGQEEHPIINPKLDAQRLEMVEFGTGANDYQLYFVGQGYRLDQQIDPFMRPQLTD